MSSNVIVQYVIVRSDLRLAKNWPLGAVIAQCCHATAAVLHVHRHDPETIAYLEDMDRMHKVVLDAKDEAALVNLSAKLKEVGIKHNMWIEHPEEIPTCIALKPYHKDKVQNYVKHLRLLHD